MADKEEKKPLVKFGPFEQAIAVLLFMGFAANPSLPYSLMGNGHGGLTGIPLFTPPFVFLVIVAYVGYNILLRQEAARDRQKALQKSSKSSSSSSSSSSRAPLSSSDIRSKGIPSSSSRSGDPGPKHVSGASRMDPRKDPSSTAFNKNYFLTMQGPGRPALVPFQAGLRPKAGQAAGTMWWDDVPETAEQLMAPPIDSDQIKSMVRNPYSAEIIGKDIELLKLKKRRKEEGERYEKVGQLLHTILGGLLCAVDVRLGVACFVFFLYRHFSMAQAREHEDEQTKLDQEKKDLMNSLSEAKRQGADRSEIQELQQKLMRM